MRYTQVLNTPLAFGDPTQGRSVEMLIKNFAAPAAWADAETFYPSSSQLVVGTVVTWPNLLAAPTDAQFFFDTAGLTIHRIAQAKAAGCVVGVNVVEDIVFFIATRCASSRGAPQPAVT